MNKKIKIVFSVIFMGIILCFCNKKSSNSLPTSSTFIFGGDNCYEYKKIRTDSTIDGGTIWNTNSFGSTLTAKVYSYNNIYNATISFNKRPTKSGTYNVLGGFAYTAIPDTSVLVSFVPITSIGTNDPASYYYASSNKGEIVNVEIINGKAIITTDKISILVSNNNPSGTFNLSGTWVEN